MAFSPSPSVADSLDQERPSIESIRAIVVSITQHLHALLTSAKVRKLVKSNCTSKLKARKQGFFEFSEQSVLSNLYWGIESVEAAILAKRPDERASRLKNSEQMLQAPALLDEHGVTAGVPNSYLVGSSYFYLSAVRKLQGDDWQAALHFLQALSVSPIFIQTEFAPKLCTSLLLSCIVSDRQGTNTRRGSETVSLTEHDDDDGKVLRQMARRYKAWLTYYQVMSYGGSPQQQRGSLDIPSAQDELQYLGNRNSASTQSSNSHECGNTLQACHKFEKVHPVDPREYTNDNPAEESKQPAEIPRLQEHMVTLECGEVDTGGISRSSNTGCLRDMLNECQSDTSISGDSYDSGLEEDAFEVHGDQIRCPRRTIIANGEDPQSDFSDWKQQSLCLPGLENATSPPKGQHFTGEAVSERRTTNSERCHSSFSHLELSVFELKDMNSYASQNFLTEKKLTGRKVQKHNHQILDSLTSTELKNQQIDHQGSSMRRGNPYMRQNISEGNPQHGKDSQHELMGILEKTVAKLCFSDGLLKFDEDYSFVFVKIYGLLCNKEGVKYTLLKDVILDQLLTAISTSKEVALVRASVSILSTLVSGNKAAIEDIKKKGLPLRDLASALKRDVHEAAILIYLTNPSPTEIKKLELLPSLVEVVCTSDKYKARIASLVPTPPAASLMIIEVLVTAFDYATNNMHLAAINAPRVLAGLLDIQRYNNLKEFTSLATILVRCMQFDGQCRKYISEFTPVAPFIYLLSSNQERAKSIALDYFHEILQMPRSSANKLLQQMRREGSINTMHMLMLLIQKSQPEYKLLAANLLLQLDMLESIPGKSLYREEAIEILLESVACEQSSSRQQLSAFLLSNLGGTYSWAGEPYTVAWLLKKTGLSTCHHRNMIRNFNWLDQSLQDASTDIWCSQIARIVIKIGEPVFCALEKGLKSEIKKVSRDCLTAITWIGCEIVKCPEDFRYRACDILLSTVQQFLHPGLELEERLLACLCVYNYTSGKGMQKLIHFSEGVRESLRRLSTITWMAEELLRVADYFHPNKWRISCVHTQVVEAGQINNGAVTSLIYYKGLLYSGYGNGSIKGWNINGQTATLVLEMKEHRKAVTCFSLFEPGDCLLSASVDKTIRIWQMVQGKLECIEVIGTREPIQSLDSHGKHIFAISQSQEMKVFDTSRTDRDYSKAKHVKCMKVVHGKVYVGCMDSSIREIDVTKNQEREIKASSKAWRMQSRPINSIAVYKDWLYCASATVEGSSIKEWRRQSKPRITIVPEGGTNVRAMEIVEDFVYLNCNQSPNILQIWLRGTQQKVGRLSAGSKITSLLAANDMVFCGTETGLIKGWIPL